MAFGDLLKKFCEPMLTANPANRANRYVQGGLVTGQAIDELAELAELAISNPVERKFIEVSA
jgi:hypothetical protein